VPRAGCLVHLAPHLAHGTRHRTKH